MKKIVILLLTAFLAGPAIVAQNQNKEKKVQKTEKVKTQKQQPTDVKDTQKDGNAYGKNKENLEGKDFGQSRKDNAQISKEKNKKAPAKKVKTKKVKKQKTVTTKPNASKTKKQNATEKAAKPEEPKND